MPTDLSWQASFASGWIDRAHQDRLPHAVMLIGPAGVGKRAAALWMATQRLRPGSNSKMPVYPGSNLEHPDFRWIGIPEDKKAIGIEQIRSLVAELNLTSYEGDGKVAVIAPADAMTGNAANSLLKTLEEPPGDALLILVADKVGRLPATIFSRCQRIDMNLPPTDVALAWLDRVQPGAKWPDALVTASGAPLGAIAALENLDTTASLGRDLNVIASSKGSAIEVAARWSKMEPRFVLDWFAQQISLAGIAAFAGRASAPGLAIDDSVLRRMDRRNLFCYLDIINRLRGQTAGSYNVQLSLEGLLIDWADGLRDCTESRSADGMQLMRAQ